MTDMPVVELSALTQREYVVVLRARSAARFRPEEGSEFFFPDVPGCEGMVRVRVRTRWVDEGHEAPIPRELWIEARGKAPSLDHAISKFTAVARMLATLTAFTANTQVGMPEVHVGYDATEGQRTRDFLEVFVPDERGHPSEGRLVQTTELAQVFEQLVATPEAERVSRALGQYGLALRYWYFGGEWLALAHLYMAVETLTKSVVRDRCDRDGISEEELAKSLGVKVGRDLEVWARRDIIFNGDADTYRNTRYASDGVEHGFLELDEVHKHALAETGEVFTYVRHAILRLLGLDQTVHTDLFNRVPRDVQSLRRIIRGELIGDGTDPAAETDEYPYLTWNSSVKAWRRSEDKFTFSFEDRFTVRCSPAYTFVGTAMEVRGRNEPNNPIRLDPVHDVQIKKTSPPPAEVFTLMRRAHTFTNTVTALGLSVGIPPLLSTVFGMAAVQLGHYEAIEQLLKDNRPAEAIVLLGNLTQGACRLQAIAQHDSPTGVAVRIRLDALDRQAKLYADDENFKSLANKHSVDLVAAARSKNITIPDMEPDAATTPFHVKSGQSLAFSREVARGDDAAAALHTVKDDQGAQALNTRVSDEALIRGTATSAASALMVTSIALATILGWPIDQGAADQVEAEIARIEEDA